jgi:hypothetical protein
MGCVALTRKQNRQCNKGDAGYRIVQPKTANAARNARAPTSMPATKPSARYSATPRATPAASELIKQSWPSEAHGRLPMGVELARDVLSSADTVSRQVGHQALLLLITPQVWPQRIGPVAADPLRTRVIAEPLHLRRQLNGALWSPHRLNELTW